MDTATAFALGAAHRNSPSRVFDWIKAATLIRESLEKYPNVEASAGLAGDWEYTGGEIFRNGKPVPEKDTYTYLCSTWATPELCIDGQYLDCWVWEKDSPGWDAETYWPQEALEIIHES